MPQQYIRNVLEGEPNTEVGTSQQSTHEDIMTGRERGTYL